MEVNICITWASSISVTELHVRLTCGYTLVRTVAFCAGPPQSNTQPVLLNVLQSLAAHRNVKRMLYLVLREPFFCFVLRLRRSDRRGNSSSARRSAIGYS